MRRRVALGALLSISAGAGAGERFDHQGAVLALAAPGVGLSLTASSVSVNGIRWCALLGGGVALGSEHLEALVLGRVSGRTDALDVAALAGLRTNFGDERWKTYADLQLSVLLLPWFAVGPRFGVGIQYEASPVAGVFCGAAVLAGVGRGLIVAGDVTCGLQLRTYVL
ncbi:MAG TPA: hypothetical protein VFA20_02195 [Myxococcaceae bacterium]|nr:hypothetical protein [Myxococcaceae bacterium]